MELKLEYFFSHMHEFNYPEVFQDIEYPWQALVKAKKLLQDTIVKDNTMESKATIKGKVCFENNYLIGQGTIISNDVTIEGPVIIGENCQIASGALIRPGTIIGNNCVIGHCCEVKASVVQNGAKLQSFCFVGDSVIGKSARVGSGAIVANRRFDQASVKVKSDSGRIDTESSFMGCILGDNSRIGANAVTIPGTIIGPYSWIFPSTCVRGTIPANKRVFHERPLVMTENEKIDLKP